MPFNTTRMEFNGASSSRLEPAHGSANRNRVWARFWQRRCIAPMWWVACLGFIVSASPGLAQTFVSEAIIVDTHWTSINGLYLISGDVILQNGAELVIDPGVTVYMQADASL